MTDEALLLQTAHQVAVDILAQRSGIEALRHIADAARHLARARYGALGVANTDGVGLAEFVSVGLSDDAETRIGARPSGNGILGLLLQIDGPLRIDNLADHPQSVGFPKNHPPMDSFLGVPIRRGDGLVLGSLYLTNKENGDAFTEADSTAVQALAAHAAVAIYHLQLQSRQRTLLSGIIAAQEEERRAIAYELHDGLTQTVMAAHAHLEAARRAQLGGNGQRAEREMERSRTYLKDAVAESRRLVTGLRALALDDLGLAGAVEQLVDDEKARADWAEASFLHNISGRRFDRPLETAAFRVAQEALTNARKHARATRIRVVLLVSPDGAGLNLEIRDDGVGFVPEETVGDYHHLGLHGMRERVSILGGTYLLRSTPGAGTTIQAQLPVLPSPGNDAP
jgi:signal transduction histidine kinase